MTFFNPLAIAIIFVVLIFLLTTMHSKQNTRVRRTEYLRGIAAELKAGFAEYNGELAGKIKPLMRFRNSGIVYESLELAYRNGKIIVADFSYLARVGFKYRRFHQTVLVLPLTEIGAPEFSMRPRTLIDRIVGRLGWQSVQLSAAEFNRKITLNGGRGAADEVREFFETRQELVQLCVDMDQFSMSSSGEWLVFYRVGELLDINYGDYRRRFMLGRRLYDVLMPADVEGKAAGFDLADDSWLADSQSYEEFLASLKVDQS